MASSVRFPSSLKASLRRLSSGYTSAAAGAGGGAESAAYRLSMLRPPATVPRRRVPWNSCNLMGTVVRPVKPFANTGPRAAAYTFLEVARSPRDSSSSFQVLLAMRDEIAEISLKHLQPNDFIYVRGSLSSYEKVNASGNREIFQKVYVEDMNYVKRSQRCQILQKPKTLGEDESTGPATVDHENKYVDHLRLWQIFFANPFEWWDNRERKLNSRYPDFRHKDTHEGLWLKPDDPPWVRKQLQLYDSEVAGIRRKKDGGWSELHEWKVGNL